ncbi:hypothetical protein ES705_25922 [subsurface metagenome]
MQCPDCKSYKRGANCQACFLRVNRRLAPFARALYRVSRRFLQVRNARNRLLADLNAILFVTSDYRLKEKIQERMQEE